MPKHKIAIETETLDSPETIEAHKVLLNFLHSPEMAEKIDIIYVSTPGIIDHSWMPSGTVWIDAVGPFTLSYYYAGETIGEVKEQRASYHNDIINFVRNYYKEREHQYVFPIPEQDRLELQQGAEVLQRILQCRTPMFRVSRTVVTPEFATKLDKLERKQHEAAVSALVRRTQRNETVASSSSSPEAHSRKPDEDKGFGFIFN